MLRGGEVVSRRAHNPEAVGSIPTPANICILSVDIFGISLAGRAPDSESGGPRFDP